jgi:hypothetical protein
MLEDDSFQFTADRYNFGRISTTGKQNQTPTSFKRSHQSTSGDGGLYGMVPLSIVLYYVGLIIRSRAFAEQSISGSDPWNPKCVSGL